MRPYARRALLAFAVVAALAVIAAGAGALAAGRQDAAARRLSQHDYVLQQTAGRMQEEFTSSQFAISSYALSGLPADLTPVSAVGAAFSQNVRSLAALAPAGLQALVRTQQQAGMRLFEVASRISGLPPHSAAVTALARRTAGTARDFVLANSRFQRQLAVSGQQLTERSGHSLGTALGWGIALAVTVLLVLAALAAARAITGPWRWRAGPVRGRAAGEPAAAAAGPAGMPAVARADGPPPGEAEDRPAGQWAVNLARSDFLAMFSHELRAPLTTIEGYVEMLADEGPDQVTPRQQKMLDSISRSAVRLRTLIDDVFTLARLESGAASLAVRPVNLPGVIAVAAEAVRPAVVAAGLSLSCTAEPGMTVAGDAGQLERLMINLLSNAVKFTPGDGGITVTAAAEDEWGVITVADSGIGIPERDQKELFTRFFRASNARERAIPGTGLGLAIVRTIVVSHGGEVGVESREGSGTTVTVRLPLRCASAS
jgi:signal transduction histidine kinase